MKETVVETYLTQRIEECNGLCEKHVSPGLVGVPDRLVTWRDGRMFLVETKAPLGRVRPTQARDHRRRAKRGVKVLVIHTKERVDEFLVWLCRTENTNVTVMGA